MPAVEKSCSLLANRPVKLGSAPLVLHPQPLEVLVKLADWRRLCRSREARREAVFAPDHGVLTAGIVAPLKAFEGDPEVGDCIWTGLEALGLMRLTNRSMRCRLRRAVRTAVGLIVMTGDITSVGSTVAYVI